jgi:hypothetical protein
MPDPSTFLEIALFGRRWIWHGRTAQLIVNGTVVAAGVLVLALAWWWR